MSSHLEEAFRFQCVCLKIPMPVQEYKFHPDRQWRFDFAWPDKKVAVEIEGAVWTGGRHTRGYGYIADCEKYNQAIICGWKVFRFTDKDIKSCAASQLIKKFLEGEYDAK